MDEIMEILRELRPDIDFEREEQLIDGGLLDSMDIVSLISELCQEFDISIGAQYIRPENFNSARAICALVQRLCDEDF